MRLERSPRLLLAAIVAAGAMASLPGTDYDDYWTTARQLLTGRIETFDPDRMTESESTNVGYRKHSWGAAAEFAPFVAAAGVVLGDSVASYRGFAFSAFVGLGLTLLLLWRAGRRLGLDHDAAAVVTMIILLATPVAFHLVSVSSECWLLPAATGLACLALGDRPLRPLGLWAEAMLAGTLTALLLANRPYLAVYGMPAMLRVLLDARGIAQRTTAIVLPVIPLGLSLCSVAYQNFSVTGLPWRSPYDFGDGQWRSLELLSPHSVVSALTSPYHGLLPYAPLAGLGFVILATLLPVACWRTGRRVEAAIWCAFAVAIGVNVWFVGSFYYWDMAARFGSRGLVLAGIPTVLAAERFVLVSRVPSKFVWIVAAPCVAWSFLLLAQGPHNYTAHVSLARSVPLELLAWVATPRRLATFVLVGVPVALTVLGARHRVALGLTGTLCLVFLVDRRARSPASFQALEVAGTLLLLAAVAVRPSWPVRRWIQAAYAGLALQFAFATFLVGRAWTNTRVEVVHPGALQFTSDVQTAARCFLGVPAQRAHGERIAAFLARQGIEKLEPVVFENLHWSEWERRHGMPWVIRQ